MSLIINTATATPLYQHEQRNILSYMLNVYGVDGDFAQKISRFYERSGINKRHSSIPDFTESWNKQMLFNEPNGEPSVQKRMQVYRKNVLPLAKEALSKCCHNTLDFSEITHLITVSCTGMSAPGLDLALVQALNLPHNIYRTSVNFMGCYAAFHALKQADFICRAEPMARVAVVCVELCTLHFQEAVDMDNITSTMLFADGAAAFVMTGETYAREKGLQGLCVRKCYSEVAFEGEQDMSWDIHDTGFIMKLTAYVPKIIAKNIKPLLHNALRHSNLSNDSVNHWCIHPGGRKILEVTSAALALAPNALAASYKVLHDYGNMSSPTVLFVLHELWNKHINWKASTPESVFALSFGPGLTMESAVLETVNYA